MCITDESSHKIDGQMIDTATLVDVLENTANMGLHVNSVEHHMAPVAQAIFEETLDDEMRLALTMLIQN